MGGCPGRGKKRPSLTFKWNKHGHQNHTAKEEGLGKKECIKHAIGGENDYWDRPGAGQKECRETNRRSLRGKTNTTLSLEREGFKT